MCVIHGLLSKIPDDLPLETLLTRAYSLYQRYSPDELAHEAILNFKRQQRFKILIFQTFFFLAVPASRAFLIVGHLASINPSINFFSLSHLPWDHWSDFFETCLRCSPSDLVVSARKWFGSSNDKYSHRQLSLIFTIITSRPKPLEEFCRNLAYEFLSVPRCVGWKTILVHQQMWLKGSHL